MDIQLVSIFSTTVSVLKHRRADGQKDGHVSYSLEERILSDDRADVKSGSESRCARTGAA